MQVCTNVKRLCTSLQDMVGFRRRKDMKSRLQISQPFDFKKEATILPGLTEDEISVLREKAAASRIGIADHRGSRSASPDYMNPRLPPPIPVKCASRRSASMTTRLSVPLAAVDTRPLSSSLPVSPSSTMGSGTPIDLDFQLGSPVSPLSPRGSPRSMRSKMV